MRDAHDTPGRRPALIRAAIQHCRVGDPASPSLLACGLALGGSGQAAIYALDQVAAHYRAQVANLAEVLNRAEAAERLRSLADRIGLAPNASSKPDMDLCGGIRLRA
jgi:hypothetical protein